MRKEIVFAIVSGAFLGLIIAFGIWRANSAISEQKKENNNQEESGSQTTAPSASPSVLGITIAKPSELDVITETPTTISGLTKPSALVVISSETKDYIFYANSSGAFEQEVDLEPGLNQIVISSFESNGTKYVQNLNLVYSSEFAKAIENVVSEETAASTDEASAIREKVQETLSAKTKSPKTYIGTITDIAEDTLQVSKFSFSQTQSSEIQQVATATDTTYVKVGKTNKEINFPEVAIGDFIIAMGFKNGSGVLDARRVLITSPIEATKRVAFSGIVTAIENKTISLKTEAGNSLTGVFGKEWEGPELKDVSEEDKVILVGEDSEGKITVRTLFIIPKATGSPSPSPSPKSTP